MYQRNRKNAICRRYYCLLHIYAATVISFLTTGAEESEKGTGKTTTDFVLKSPLERIPASYCCASMEALWARLHCNAFWGRLVIWPFAFIMSHKVCDDMNVGRVWQANQVTLEGICFKKRTNFCIENAEHCTVGGFVQKPKSVWLIKQCNFFRAILYLGQSYFTKGKWWSVACSAVLKLLWMYLLQCGLEMHSLFCYAFHLTESILYLWFYS